MHIIEDIEGFLKEIEQTVYHWFGTGITGEQGKDAIKAVICAHAIPVGAGPAIPDEQPDAIISSDIPVAPPLDNDHVAPGCELFNEETITDSKEDENV